MSILSRLYVHPVKSIRGLQLSHALAGAEGLAFDRVFMLTDADGTFITARQYPQMLLFAPVVLPGGLHLTAPDGQPSRALCRLFRDGAAGGRLGESFYRLSSARNH